MTEDQKIVAIARLLAKFHGFDYDRPDLGGMASEHHIYVMYEEQAGEILKLTSELAALQSSSEIEQRVNDHIERLQVHIETLRTQLKRTEDALDKEFQNGIALKAENERLRAEVKAEEDTVYSCMAKLKENGAEIERLRAALRMVIDNVETSSYESTGFWRTRHDRHR